MNWETVKITIPDNSEPFLTCTCLRPCHFGFPCKHGMLALEIAERDNNFCLYQSLLNAGAKHWYDTVYHVDTFVKQYQHKQCIEIPVIPALDESNLWPAAMA